MSAPSDGARADARKARAAAAKPGVYISRDQLAEWRADATERSSRADAHLVFAARILGLIDALEAPCGSCHPCNNWANQTWVNAGERLPHLHEWQEMKAERDSLAGVIADAKAEALREVAAEWSSLGRDAALFDYGRWVDAAARMLRIRAIGIEQESGR